MRSLTAAAVDPGFVAALVLLAALLHASWNALIKGSDDPLGRQAVLMASGMLLAALVVPWVEPPARAAWPFIALSVGVHAAYRTFVVLSYRHGDLSTVYPLARGFAPLAVALAAIPLAGERLSAPELAGVALVSAGIVSLALEPAARGRARRLPVALALATGVTVCCYSLIDGLGGRSAGSVLGYAAWLMMLEPLPFLAAVAFLRRGRWAGTWRAHRRAGFAGGAISIVSYGIVIWAMSVGGMAHAVALRETSVIVAALIGVFVFREAAGPRRIAAALVVAAGNLLLQLT